MLNPFIPVRWTETAAEIRYFDTITLKHRDTKAFLHSHTERYPLTYEDGRISSAGVYFMLHFDVIMNSPCVFLGQQVTGYTHNDTNNFWQIIPTKAIPETGKGRVVRNGDVVQLLHVNTQTVLLTHDVASPLMPTNQEFTTWPKDDHSTYNETLFQILLPDQPEGAAWKTKSGYFRLIHIPTKVSMWTHTTPLPDWAYKQQEINGNKNPVERTAIWVVDEIIDTEGKFSWNLPLLSNVKTACRS